MSKVYSSRNLIDGTLELVKKVLAIVIVSFVFGSVAIFVIGRNKFSIPKTEFDRSTVIGRKCPEPFIFKLPIDIDKATSVLYPGQIRGGEYKAHGGFRFDKSRPDEITVTVPYDAEVVAGARYPVNGEIQYTFDFAHPCGIRYRFGHLLTLTPKFQAIADKFPLPTGLDSRTTEVRPPVSVRQGEVIATAAGLNRGGPAALGGLNTFLDWGVYDYRQKNEASKDPVWTQKYSHDIYQYAVCWFDWISPKDRSTILSLPSSDYQSGKTSDYCK